MGEFQRKTIILPSGKKVEIVYLTSEVNNQGKPQDPWLSAANPGICPACLSSLVCPIYRNDRDNVVYTVFVLRCPECEWCDSRIMSREVVIKFDDLLRRTFAQMFMAAEDLAKEIREKEIEMFVCALKNDGIMPFDF